MLEAEVWGGWEQQLCFVSSVDSSVDSRASRQLVPDARISLAHNLYPTLFTVRI